MKITRAKENLPKESTEEFTRLSSEGAGAPRLFMFSGGSAMRIVDFLPADFFKLDDTLTALDERYAPEEAASNFAQLLKKK